MISPLPLPTWLTVVWFPVFSSMISLKHGASQFTVDFSYLFMP